MLGCLICFSSEIAAGTLALISCLKKCPLTFCTCVRTCVHACVCVCVCAAHWGWWEEAVHPKSFCCRRWRCLMDMDEAVAQPAGQATYALRPLTETRWSCSHGASVGWSTLPNTTLLQPERFCSKVGSDVSHGNGMSEQQNNPFHRPTTVYCSCSFRPSSVSGKKAKQVKTTSLEKFVTRQWTCKPDSWTLSRKS